MFFGGGSGMMADHQGLPVGIDNINPDISLFPTHISILTFQRYCVKENNASKHTIVSMFLTLAFQFIKGIHFKEGEKDLNIEVVQKVIYDATCYS
ncbi:hypothetical protein ACHQM5_007439 [Ranunculus cassubicifolius]